MSYDKNRGFSPTHHVAQFLKTAPRVWGEDGEFMLEVVGHWAMPNPIDYPEARTSGREIEAHGPENAERWHVLLFCLN